MDLMMIICQNAFTESTCSAILSAQIVQLILGLGGMLVVTLVVYGAITLLHKLEGE